MAIPHDSGFDAQRAAESHWMAMSERRRLERQAHGRKRWRKRDTFEGCAECWTCLPAMLVAIGGGAAAIAGIDAVIRALG